MHPAPKATRAVLAAVLAASAVGAASPAAQLNMSRLLDRYAAGEFEAVAKIVVEEEAARPGSLLPELQTGGQRWVDRAQTWEGSRARRLTAAAFALEVAGAPTFVTTSIDLERPTARTISRFEAMGLGFASTERRGLLAWSLRLFLDVRSRDQEIARAHAEGQSPTQLDEVERRWFLAAVALLSGSNDILMLAGPPAGARRPGPLGLANPGQVQGRSVLELARLRFPEEPRFRLAEVYANEMRTTSLSQANLIAIQTQTPEDGIIPKRVLDRRPDPQAVTVARPGLDFLDATEYALSLLDGIGAGYEAMASEPDLRVEALVRLGYHRLRVGDREAALDAFSQALASPAEAGLHYLARFFRGWALHRLGRRQEAEGEYEAALRIYPASRQVRILLAAVLADRGHRQDAREVLSEFLSRTLPLRDPWTTFHQGDARFWPQRVVDLREALR